MPNKQTTLLTLCLSVAFGSAEYGQGEDIERTKRVLRSVQEKLSRIGQLVSSPETDAPAIQHADVSVKSLHEQTVEINRQLAEVEQELLKHVDAEFAALKKRQDLNWKFALRHKPFLEKRPDDLAILVDNGATTFKKTGNPATRPVARSTTYHICPSVPMQFGDRALIRFSIPRTPSRGGTPVPYFGIRDAEGREQVLGSLIDDGKTHELRIRYTGAQSFAFYDQTMNRSFGRVDILSDPVFIFFHMNDTSEINIHEIRLSQEATNQQ